MDKKILLIDLETAPNLGYVWEKWETNVMSFKEDWYILSFSYKWLGDKTTHVLALPDFSLYKKDKTNDRMLVGALWGLFDKAEVVIAHNGDEFDMKKANARFITHDLKPPTPYKTVDTLKVARRYFKFDSNKLDDLGDYLGLGRKISTGGFNLWLGCMNGDKNAWKTMIEYNKQDVVLLEKVYTSLRPWMTNHPNMNLYSGVADSCPNCGAHKLQRRGFNFTRVSKRQRFQCTSCGAWSQGASEKLEEVIVR